MKLLQKLFCAFVSTLGLLAGCAVAADEPVAPAAQTKRDVEQTWIERPWDMQYFLAVDAFDGWEAVKKLAIQKNAKPATTYFGWAEFFSPTSTMLAKPSEFFGEQKFAVVAVEFDKQGFVTTTTTHAKHLRGRLNQLRYLTLSAGEAPNDRVYPLAIWFTGIGDASTDWAPGFCFTNQQPDAAQVKSDGYLYGALFKVSEFEPVFGCREWAAQLYDNERPYIDVTSYVREGKVYPKYTYIRNFIGWARFGDKKPVIGKHERDWYCLHECPAGDKPGLIPDIKVWASKNGWSVPKPPSKAPTFVDPPATPGFYRK